MREFCGIMTETSMTTASHPINEVVPLFCALGLSPDPVFVTDRRNNMIFWNESARKLLGFNTNEVLGGGCASILQGADSHGNRYCSENCPIVQIARKNETVRHFNLQLRAKDGASVLVDVSILTITVSPPEHFYLAHILQPVGDQRLALTSDAPSAPRLVVVKESSDVRARRLTQREVEILAMLSAGLSGSDIASRLHISPLTARNHIQNILVKLEVHSKTEAVAFAFQKKLI